MDTDVSLDVVPTDIDMGLEVVLATLNVTVEAVLAGINVTVDAVLEDIDVTVDAVLEDIDVTACGCGCCVCTRRCWRSWWRTCGNWKSREISGVHYIYINTSTSVHIHHQSFAPSHQWFISIDYGLRRWSIREI